MVLLIGYVYLILIENRSENNTCYTLDSLSRGKITKNVEKKICALLLCKEPVIKVVINPVQQLGKGANCEVFAIAYAASLAFSENPSLCSYNVSIMRQQLVNCLEKETMYPFPKQDSTKRVSKSKKKKKNQLLLSIYCSCRTVCQYEREDPVVECMRCYEWFHQKCEKIPRRVFINKAANLFCKRCNDLASSDLLEHLQVK